MDDNQGKFTLSQDDIDIIGEVSNISMGSAATALSNIMGKKVVITSPHVEIGSEESLMKLEQVPSLGVIISYTEGVVGQDFLIIRQKDATEIVKALMGDIGGEEEFGEIQISAIAEVMNQMMGSSATALSNFLGRTVNISPPTAFVLTEENKKEKLDFIYRKVDEIVLVRFLFTVEEVLESELYMIMTQDFSRELVEGMMSNLNMTMGDGDGEAPAPASGPEENTPAPEPGAWPASSGPEAGEIPEPMPSAPPVYEAPPAAAPQANPEPQPAYAYAPPAPRPPARETAVTRQPAPMQVRPVQLASFDSQAPVMTGAEQSNFELIRDVPLELSVEVGKAHKLVKEIIDFSVGSIIELDKQAGDPVDIVVNGQLIAHGEVVVIDESFGVRITEIIEPKNTGK